MRISLRTKIWIFLFFIATLVASAAIFFSRQETKFFRGVITEIPAAQEITHTITADPVTFNPVAAAENNEVITFTFDPAPQIGTELAIFNSDNVAIYNSPPLGMPVPMPTAVWDGKNTVQEIVPNGSYRVLLVRTGEPPAIVGETTVTIDDAHVAAPVAPINPFDATNFSITTSIPEDEGIIEYADGNEENALTITHTVPSYTGTATVDISLLVCNSERLDQCVQANALLNIQLNDAEPLTQTISKNIVYDKIQELQELGALNRNKIYVILRASERAGDGAIVDSSNHFSFIVAAEDAAPRQGFNLNLDGIKRQLNINNINGLAIQPVNDEADAAEDAPEEITYSINADRAVFNPSANQSLTFGFFPSTPENSLLRVLRNANNEKIYEQRLAANNAIQELTWSGKIDNTPIPDGAYTAQFIVGTDVKASTTFRVMINEDDGAQEAILTIRAGAVPLSAGRTDDAVRIGEFNFKATVAGTLNRITFTKAAGSVNAEKIRQLQLKEDNAVLASLNAINRDNTVTFELDDVNLAANVGKQLILAGTFTNVAEDETIEMKIAQTSDIESSFNDNITGDFPISGGRVTFAANTRRQISDADIEATCDQFDLNYNEDASPKCRIPQEFTCREIDRAVRRILEQLDVSRRELERGIEADPAINDQLDREFNATYDEMKAYVNAEKAQRRCDGQPAPQQTNSTNTQQPSDDARIRALQEQIAGLTAGLTNQRNAQEQTLYQQIADLENRINAASRASAPADTTQTTTERDTTRAAQTNGATDTLTLRDQEATSGESQTQLRRSDRPAAPDAAALYNAEEGAVSDANAPTLQSSARIYTAPERGDTGPELLVYPLIILGVNTLLYFRRRKKKN